MSQASDDSSQRSPEEIDAIHKQMYEDIQWARSNAKFQELHKGHYVVVHKKQFLGAGRNRRELLDAAASPEHPRNELVVVAIVGDDFEIPPDLENFPQPKDP